MKVKHQDIKYQDMLLRVFVWIVLPILLWTFIAKLSYVLLYKKQVCQEIYRVLDMEQVLAEQVCKECGV